MSLRCGDGVGSAPAPAIVPAPAPLERWTPAIVAAPIWSSLQVRPAAETAASTTLQGDTKLLRRLRESGGAGYALFSLIRIADRCSSSRASEIAGGVNARRGSTRRCPIATIPRRELRDIDMRSATSAPRTAAVAATNADKTTAQRGATRLACAPPTGFKGPIYR
jgi:hypothetical protein